MTRFPPAARAWVGLVATLAMATAIVAGPPLDQAWTDWLLLGLIAAAAATAHLFPIRSALGGASHRLTNVFVIAGAVLLPLSLVAVLPVLAIGPERWQHRKRSGALFGGIFNIGQTILAAES